MGWVTVWVVVLGVSLVFWAVIERDRWFRPHTPAPLKRRNIHEDETRVPKSSKQ